MENMYPTVDECKNLIIRPFINEFEYIKPSGWHPSNKWDHLC